MDMELTYKEKIIKAVNLADDFEQIEYIQDKINNTEQINRRKQEGRKLTDELLNLTQQRKIYLAENGLLPF